MTKQSFFHPDYTVGTGFSPVRATKERLVGFAECVTTDRELTVAPSHPAPKDDSIVATIICERTTERKEVAGHCQGRWERYNVRPLRTH
jgi:hypothetical protein